MIAVLLFTTAGAAAVAQSRPAPAAGDSAAAAPDSATALARGQQLSEWLWAVEVDSLWGHLSDQSRTTMGSPANIAEQVVAFVGRFGTEVSVVRESLVRQDANYRYTRVVRLEAAEEPWTLAFTLSPELRVMDLDMNPGE